MHHFFEWRLKAVIYMDFNSFKPSAPFLYPLKPPVNQRFSGGIEMEHCLNELRRRSTSFQDCTRKALALTEAATGGVH